MNASVANITWSQELIDKYNINGPRYTSYPTALALHDKFPIGTLERTLADAPEKLSLYIHLPFCHKLCYYCGCNKVITRHQHKADIYLDYLAEEMALYAKLLGARKFESVHMGGGTPTFLTEQQLSRLDDLLHQHFSFTDDAEWSIEIDPRSCSDEKLRHLRALGFNRVSYGVQDFDEKVQIAINRVQDTDLIRHQVELSKELGFKSINLDLIYGLPYQRPETFKASIDQVIALAPDRVSLFSYAHLPARFAGQAKIPTESLPKPSIKLELLQLGITRFNAAGYQFIGMDHFAKTTDELAIAQQQGRLQRNFQGYTTSGQDALLGIGASSISQIDGVLWQNSKELPDYYKHLKAQRLPVIKGFELNADDRLRAALISQVICHFELDIAAFAQVWQLTDFWTYFANAKQKLAPFIEDGLVTIDDSQLRVTELGRLWVRSICACFDAYLDDAATAPRYSKVV
ncbi:MULTISPECIES: oxygen-independent coproporphyrinogen III oxidase [Idiomarina]|uniref:oxygen-independent coproporphyrinogen III oxidase n=1 Tax=Idiomarina TaxID=135575 RepID=UPI00129B866C|nr:MULTISPECIES: oxygen-independent coproporphyrinogen III oxidase [Idiomarina]MRJ41721.1 oxygen-independent coproporphyrinogen III oxidase [Idiomarina sp. FeN1]NCU57711.1 oxygen-independent coproporphyrinogen III oxidase [Idiomarina sp. FenA--70]NCU60263.1 oxygen-independent coproporphyrinogen III oxidase [Idiomarina sp. FenBw--71]UUN13393.1 oxygen-independent coproporphyrinogen III oxidase [Idiomarina loihiensis]